MASNLSVFPLSNSTSCRFNLLIPEHTFYQLTNQISQSVSRLLACIYIYHICLGKYHTLMSPVLILASVPTSRTGVLPVRFLSSSGPNRGRLRPNGVVFPRMNRETTKRKRSTRRMGSHLSNNMDSPKVEVPNISRGRTCTFTS